MNNKKLSIYVIALFAFIMMVGGVSYAYFVYNKDVGNVSIDMGNISLSFSGVTNNVNNITVIPMTDDIGKRNNDYIDFTVTATADKKSIYYEVYIVPNGSNTLNNNYLKMYLTDQNDAQISGSQYYPYLRNSLENNGKIIYSDTIVANTDGSNKTVTKSYRLRFWLSDNYPDLVTKNFSFSIYLYAKNINANVMDSFPSGITDNKTNFTRVEFIEVSPSTLNNNYVVNNSTIFDLTKKDSNNRKIGDVRGKINNDVLTIASVGKTYLSTGNNLFNGWSNLLAVDFNNVDTTLVTTMAQMFRETNIKNLNLSIFNTSNVTSMRSMFYDCTNLDNLNLSGFDTSNVTDISYMFYNCVKLRTMNLNMFNTAKVTAVTHMFENCSNLDSLDLHNFNTEKVTNMSFMFNECNNLTSLDISNFNTAKVTTMQSMFRKCSKLVVLDISSFDTGKVATMHYMFRDNTSLVTIYASDLWTTSAVTGANYMFLNDNNLVGGKGTPYSSDSYSNAKIDGKDGTDGYFTDIKDKPSV